MVWIVVLAVAALVAILAWVGGRPGTSAGNATPSGTGMPVLAARVSAVQTGSITVELADDPKGAFVAMFAKTSDGSLQRLKPRVSSPRSLTADLQPGSEWLLILLGAGPEEPGELNTAVMNAVHKDPGINAFPMLPGVARVARLEVPAN
jgi:hypothetical protein